MCRQDPLQTLYNKVHVFSIQTQNKTKQNKKERKTKTISITRKLYTTKRIRP